MISRKPLWFGLLGGAGAWTAHLMLAYGIAEFGCVGRLGEQEYLGISLVAWLELALTIAMTGAATAATIVAYHVYRRRQSNEPDDNSITAERYTAWAGFITSALFTFIIIFESIPILYYLRSC